MKFSQEVRLEYKNVPSCDKHFFFFLNNVTLFFFLNSSFSAHFTLFPTDGFSSNSKLTPASKVTKCDVIALISGDKRSINVIIKNSV